MIHSKEIVLLILLFICPVISFAQNQSEKNIILSEDFNGGLPENWLNVDLSDENMHWYWSDTTVIGCYTYVSPEIIKSTTVDNGFMVMNGDGYNTVPQFTHQTDGASLPGVIDFDGYIQSPAIDLSNYENVVLEIYQHVRPFGDLHTDIWISTDYIEESPDLTHWYKINTIEIPSNETKEGLFHTYIPDYIAGHPSVTFRFYAYGSSHYYWVLDDFKLFEPYEHDLQVQKSWIFYDWMEKPPETSPIWDGFNQHGGYYTKIPWSQVDTIVGFKMLIRNIGRVTQTNPSLNLEIYHKTLPYLNDSLLVYSTTHIYDSLEVGILDTLELLTEFTPENIGIYNIYLTVGMDNDDQDNSNNTAFWTFEVTDSIYSRTGDEMKYQGKATTSGSPIGLGTYYKLNNELTEVDGIRWYFDAKNSENDYHLSNGNFSASAKLYSYNYELDNWNTEPLLTSNTITLSYADTNTFINTLFNKDGISEFVPVGEYLVFLETIVSNISMQHSNRKFWIGRDNSIQQPGGIVYEWRDEWLNHNLYNPKIDLIIEPQPVYIKESKSNSENGLILAQNYPNPASEKTVIKYKLPKVDYVIFEIYDITGKQILQADVGEKPVGLHTLKLDVSGFNSGIYYYTFKTTEFKVTRKLIIIK